MGPRNSKLVFNRIIHRIFKIWRKIKYVNFNSTPCDRDCTHSFEFLEHIAHYTTEINTICMNWGLLGSIWHQEPHVGAQGSPPPPWHPTSAKRVNRVEERKLLPESETL